MTIAISVYSNSANVTKTINIDFVGDILAASTKTASDRTPEYYFKFDIPITDTLNRNLDPKVCMSLSDLALNGAKQSASNTANAYSDIHTMVIDYSYDYINGHTADQYSSGVTEEDPMAFS